MVINNSEILKLKEYVKEFSGDFKNYLEYLLRDLLDNQLSLGRHKQNSQKIVRIMNFLDILDTNSIERQIEPSVNHELFVKNVKHLLKENLRSRDSLIQFLRDTTKDKLRTKTFLYTKAMNKSNFTEEVENSNEKVENSNEEVENSNEVSDETISTDSENDQESIESEPTENNEDGEATSDSDETNS